MFAGCIARAATVFFESEDFMYRLQMGLALAMNSILILQFALYWHNTEDKYDKVHVKNSKDKKTSVYNKVNVKHDTKKQK